jgi:hypothetical protein
MAIGRLAPDFYPIERERERKKEGRDKRTIIAIEIAEFVVGTVSLSSLFTTCAEAYSKLKDIHDAGRDFGEIKSRLDLELRKIQYIEKKHAENDLDRDAEEVMILIQQHINERLRNIETTLLRYSPSERNPLSSPSPSQSPAARFRCFPRPKTSSSTIIPSRC